MPKAICQVGGSYCLVRKRVPPTSSKSQQNSSPTRVLTSIVYLYSIFSHSLSVYLQTPSSQYKFDQVPSQAVPIEMHLRWTALLMRYRVVGPAGGSVFGGVGTSVLALLDHCLVTSQLTLLLMAVFSTVLSIQDHSRRRRDGEVPSV
jgi:hypothetical protein